MRGPETRPAFRAASPLTFLALREANVQRLPQFKNRQGGPAHSEPDGSDWSPAQWLQAVVGELGEYANVRKKYERGDYGAVGSPMALNKFYGLAGKELADVATYLDLLAFRLGLDLGSAITMKFNEVSERVGATVGLDPQSGEPYVISEAGSHCSESYQPIDPQASSAAPVYHFDEKTGKLSAKPSRAAAEGFECAHGYDRCPECDDARPAEEIEEEAEPLAAGILTGSDAKDLVLLRDWRRNVIRRCDAAGMPAGVGLCEWMEENAAEAKRARDREKEILVGAAHVLREMCGAVRVLLDRSDDPTGRDDDEEPARRWLAVAEDILKPKPDPADAPTGGFTERELEAAQKLVVMGRRYMPPGRVPSETVLARAVVRVAGGGASCT